MTDNIIDGKAFAESLRGKVGDAVAQIAAQGVTPGLAVVLVGEDPASQVYVRNKEEKTRASGMHSVKHALPDTVSEDELLSLVRSLNADPAIHGILVQLPLPRHIDAEQIINTIDPAKDVDGFHVVNAGRLSTGQSALVPCTPLGCLMLLEDRLGDLSGANAVVVGRSNIVGKPMAQLLLGSNATVTIAHSRTRDLPALCQSADILVAAVGVPEMVRGEWVKPGATVIDVGINRIDAPERGEGKTRLVGDVEFAGAAQRAGGITPVPGGVGPMTIAVLLANTVRAACASHGLDLPDALRTRSFIG